jgi:sulfhydrogenase subunit beta (sulfur reductase)
VIPIKYLVLPKSGFNEFIESLAQSRKVMAPVRKEDGQFTFAEVTTGKPVALNYIPTILPPKKYFMPQYEALLEYDIREGQKMQAVVEHEDLVLFGVHTCDLAGIQCLNVVFSDRPKDLNYLIRKNHIAIIGFECNDYCDEYANCALMGNELPNGGYDLFFTDLGSEFLVHVATYLGDTLVRESRVFAEAGPRHLTALDALRARKRERFQPEVAIDLARMPELFDRSLKSTVWDDIGDRCLSCGNCTNVCPTCYCFNIVDEINLDLKTGKRVRVWDSCQNERFAKVAGGESFRKDRSHRKKHRFYRKFRYPVDRYAKFFCTGCGRCSRTCMAKINLKETLTALAKEQPPR